MAQIPTSGTSLVPSYSLSHGILWKRFHDELSRSSAIIEMALVSDGGVGAIEFGGCDSDEYELRRDEWLHHFSNVYVVGDDSGNWFWRRGGSGPFSGPMSLDEARASAANDIRSRLDQIASAA